MRALFWFIIFLVYLIGARWYFVCEVRQLCDARTTADDFRLKTLQFRDGETIVLSGYDHFRFDSARAQPLVNDNNFEYLSQVGAYLKDHPKRALTITGALGSNETAVQRGFYDNLGIARADAIRSMFVEMGIPQDRITLDYTIDSSNLLRRPALFAAIDTTDEKGAFTFTHMTFSDANFEYNSAVFNPGPAFQAYADSVKIYFEQVDSVDLTIVGHTDSIASQTYNNQLGQARADNARLYFLNLGLTPERIFTETKGEDEPVASNSTAEGRQKNRRVELVIQ